jgi:hypothetical protein
MLDCQLFGLNPGGHHLTNLIFHVANTLLLFVWLKQLTGALWRSTMVAALFAWHPLHVESVAWASERKDMLSAFFWMLTLIAYTRFARESKVQGPKSKVWDPKSKVRGSGNEHPVKNWLRRLWIWVHSRPTGSLASGNRKGGFRP